MIKTWTAGSFREAEVIKALRRPDKISSDKGDRQLFGKDVEEAGQVKEYYPTMEVASELDDGPEYVYVFEDDLWEVHEEADVTAAL
eukprot:1889321-Pyramimonas_sp.AAC.1